MRKATVQLLYGGKDISADVAPYLRGFTYTDHAHGKSDTLRVELEDTEGRWVDAWFPETGQTLQAVIECEDWDAKGDSQRLNCGTFQVDRVEFGGPPDVLSIDAVSTAVSSSMRREKKTRAWENVGLSEIAETIAKEQGLELLFDASSSTVYGRVDQREESDLAFLQRLAEEQGLNLKITDEQLALYDDEAYDAKPSSYTIKRGDGSLTGYRFQAQAHDTYDSAKASYWSPKDKELYQVEHKPGSAPKGSGQTLALNERYESLPAAENAAKKRLRKANKAGVSGSVDLRGHPGMQAGLNVSFSGFGAFDGKYGVESAAHKIGRSGGYATSLEFKQAMDSDGQTDIALNQDGSGL